ncbi:MAG: class I SAM-dependent methyltransferase [Thermodesulfobacteriota bacterium]
MAERKVTEFFGEKAAGTYDERNRKIRAINDNLHLLIRLVLEDLPEDASILCVGVGTGADILGLADAFPGWRFTGVDPSEHMLAVCKDRMREHSLLSRCELIHGYVGEIPVEPRFDAVLCLLVTQFVKDPSARLDMFGDMAARLKLGGFLINSEISGDTASPEFQDMMRAWKAMHRLTGAPEKNLEGMVRALREHVAVEPPSVIEGYLRDAGLGMPVRFFQALFIRAWYSRKSTGSPA